jgi:hypothetical protein
MKVKMSRSERLKFKFLIPFLISIGLLILTVLLTVAQILPVNIAIVFLIVFFVATIVSALILKFVSWHVAPAVSTVDNIGAASNVIRDKKTFDINSFDTDGATYNNMSYEEVRLRSKVTAIKGAIENTRYSLKHPIQFVFGGIILVVLGVLAFLIYSEVKDLDPNQTNQISQKLLIYIIAAFAFVIGLFVFLLIHQKIAISRVAKDPEAAEYEGVVEHIVLSSQTTKTITTKNGNFVNNRYKIVIRIAGEFETNTYLKNPQFAKGSLVIVRWNPNRPKYCLFVGLPPANSYN